MFAECCLLQLCFVSWCWWLLSNSIFKLLTLECTLLENMHKCFQQSGDVRRFTDFVHVSFTGGPEFPWVLPGAAQAGHGGKQPAAEANFRAGSHAGRAKLILGGFFGSLLTSSQRAGGTCVHTDSTARALQLNSIPLFLFPFAKVT